MKKYTYSDEEKLQEDFPEKDKRAAGRRKKDMAKALRKQHISRHVYGFAWYDNLHQYSKNKVHCSCQLCRFRSVYEPDAETYSDSKRKLSVDFKLKEYAQGESYE